MPIAKKTKSGKYRCTVYDYKDSTGKIHQKTFTADTKKEAERLANAYKDGPRLSDLTVGEAVNGYIDAKKSVLSPSTHRSYESIYNKHFKESKFGAIRLTSLDNVSVQRFISDLDLSPKSVRNISGLLTASIQMYCPGKSFAITLPAQKRPQLHTPTIAEVEQLIDAINDKELLITVLLCAFGPMRLGEACGIQYSDIDYKTNAISVHRVCVYNNDHQWIYKDVPKTNSSYRTIIYPEKVIKTIGHGFGYVITKSSPHTISERMSRTLEDNGLPHFRMHDLRHFAASFLHANQFPDQFLMSRGGWRTDSCMKRVYRNSMTDMEKEMNQKAVDLFNDMAK